MSVFKKSLWAIGQSRGTSGRPFEASGMSPGASKGPREVILGPFQVSWHPMEDTKSPKQALWGHTEVPKAFMSLPEVGKRPPEAVFE